MHCSNQEISYKDLFWSKYNISKCWCDLKNRSRSSKSNKQFPYSQQCIYASLIKIHQLVQKITQETKSGRRRDSAPITIYPQYSGLGDITYIIILTLCILMDSSFWFDTINNKFGIIQRKYLGVSAGFYRTQYPASYTHKSLGRTPQFTLPASAGTQTCLLCLSLKSQISKVIS